MQGNQWIRVCYDFGRTGTVVPKEIVERGSGPSKPVIEGVADGHDVPDNGRAHMSAKTEKGNSGLLQADVRTVNKPLASGASLSNAYNSFVSKDCGVLIEKLSWFGKKLFHMFAILASGIFQ